MPTVVEQQGSQAQELAARTAASRAYQMVANGKPQLPTNGSDFRSGEGGRWATWWLSPPPASIHEASSDAKTTVNIRPASADDRAKPLRPLSWQDREKISKTHNSISLQPIQEWEGYVTHIEQKTFHARLVDLTVNSKIETEAAEFELSDISPADLTYLAIGAVFRWTIGYTREKNGQKMRASKVFFRKLPSHTVHDLREADRIAEELSTEIMWD